MPITKRGNRGQLVIPKMLRDQFQLNTGDHFEIASNEKGDIVIKPLKAVNPEDTLTEEEERLVAEGFEELKNGNSIPIQELNRELGL